MHDGGSVCDFEEYPSIDSFLNRQKKERNPKMMIVLYVDKRD
jgi:hypothetical protein